MQLDHSKRTTRPFHWLAAVVLAGLLAACGDDGTSPPGSGAVQVTVTTTGADLDADGYSVLLDGGSAQAVGVNGAVTFASVSAGSHDVTLQGLAANCSVGAATQTVSVTAGQATVVTFLVTCAQVLVDLEVVTLTTGQGIDANGYTFAIDAGAAQAIGVNDSVTVGASPGSRSVTLADIAANCTVAGTNPRSVTVPASGSARVDFVVSCSPTQGSLVVTTTTTGVDPDPDGYTVTVDGGVNQAIGVSATVTINNVGAGARTVQLTGVADNCTVAGQNPRTVTVPATSSIQTDFTINCTNITGTVDVITTTTGVDIDANGYTVTVQGRPPAFIDVNDTTSVTGVVWGDRTVTLSNVDSNCTVTGGTNPRTVTVPQRDTVETTFTITCAALTGGLTVIAATTGTDLDADGYMVAVDGGAPQALPTNGQVVFSNVTTGDRSVQLSGIAPNCTVTPPNPATVTVPAQGNVNHTFNVSCSTLVGNVAVTTVTTGSNLDPDGYSVMVGAQAPVAIGVNAMQTVMNVPVGMRSVTLSGVASNCTVAPPHPASVTVTDGGTAPVTFNVTCFTPISNKIVFDTNRDGNSEIYAMNPNGTGAVNLTNDPGGDSQPHISFNGAKIAFVSNRDGDNEIWVMNADGSNPVKLTDHSGSDTQPAWSPDGTKIAFRSNRSGNDDVWVMNADGTNPVNLTNDSGSDALPDWSPDGTKIVFNSTRDGDSDIHVMNADGSGVMQLTNNPNADFAAAWSPSGAQIAFTSEQDGDAEIYVMNANGSSQTPLTANTSGDLAPQWSPNGSQIAFASDRDGNAEVYTMTSAGATQTNVTNNGGSDFEVSWR